jgi:hypothetical protein
MSKTFCPFRRLHPSCRRAITSSPSTQTASTVRKMPNTCENYRRRTAVEPMQPRHRDAADLADESGRECSFADRGICRVLQRDTAKGQHPLGSLSVGRLPKRICRSSGRSM